MGSTVGFCSFCTQHEIARSFSLLRPLLPLSLKPRQRLIPTTDILATVLATATARGRLRLPPRLRLTPTFCMVDTMDWDTEDTDTVSTTATTTARGRLRLPLRLRLTPTFCMVDMVLDMVILATATVLATGDTTGDKLPTPLQDLNHRRKTLTLFV